MPALNSSLFPTFTFTSGGAELGPGVSDAKYLRDRFFLSWVDGPFRSCPSGYDLSGAAEVQPEAMGSV